LVFGDSSWCRRRRFCRGKGALETTRLLVQEKGLVVDVLSSDGEAPLHIAAQEGHTAEVRLLLEQRADLAKGNSDNETPLHVAVQHVGGKKDLSHITALLESRADPTVKDGEGQDCFDTAGRYTNRSTEVQEVLSQFGARPTSTKTGEGIEAMLAEDRQPDLLAHACKAGRLQAVQQLLSLLPEEKQAGAAQAALVPAAVGNSVEVLEALAAAGAIVETDVVDEQTGTTPLTAAAGADESAIKAVRWLLARRADPTIPSKDGATPLMAASLGGYAEVVEALLQARSDINHTSALNGWTALMVASQQGNHQVVRKLLDANAQPQLTNADNHTARDLALSNNKQEVVKAIDLRAKLNDRRDARSKAATGGPPRATGDERSLDDLCAELEAPASSGGAKSGGGKKQKAAALPKASVPTSEPAAQQAKPKGKAKAAPAGPVVEKSTLVQPAAAAPVVAAASPPIAAATQRPSGGVAAAAPQSGPKGKKVPGPAREQPAPPDGGAASAASVAKTQAAKPAVEPSAGLSPAGPPAAALCAAEVEKSDARRATFLRERLQVLGRMRAMLEEEEKAIQEEISRLEVA